MTEAFAPTTDEVARAVDLQSEPLLAERVRTALLIALMSLPVFLVQDLLCFPDRRGALTAIKLVQVGILGVFLWLFRKGRKQRHAVAIALLASVVLAFVTSIAGAVRENTSTTPLVFIVVTICTAVGFPWGARTQAAFAIICSVLIGWNYFVVDGSLRPALSSPSAAAAVSAGFVSIFVAHAFERYRWQIHERELGLRQREEHFRALIENGGDLIIITAADSSVRYVSGSFHRLVGLRPETWSNIPLVDLV
ncbi:MAG TPA: PAS domain-containing protein, partial [Vicinamibacterales bacterium]|nr:PAS domain-containing protein [Vicinamibacterales bacterium]